MKFLEQATYILRKNNQKITNTRLWLLQEFNNSHTTLTPYEILQNNPQASIDITTIYRNFELFESLWLIHNISSLWWYIACKHDHDCKSHDLIICKDCHMIEETHIDNTIKKKFWLGIWAIELSGYCKKCEEKK